jgi:hypothetical protein
MASPAVAWIGKAAPTLNFRKKSSSWTVYFSPGAVTGKTKARSIRADFAFRKSC